MSFDSSDDEVLRYTKRESMRSKIQKRAPMFQPESEQEAAKPSKNGGGGGVKMNSPLRQAGGDLFDLSIRMAAVGAMP
jgi:hypothetical protein